VLSWCVSSLHLSMAGAAALSHAKLHTPHRCGQLIFPIHPCMCTCSMCTCCAGAYVPLPSLAHAALPLLLPQQGHQVGCRVLASSLWAARALLPLACRHDRPAELVL